MNNVTVEITRKLLIATAEVMKHLEDLTPDQRRVALVGVSGALLSESLRVADLLSAQKADSILPDEEKAAVSYERDMTEHHIMVEGSIDLAFRLNGLETHTVIEILGVEEDQPANGATFN